MFKIHKRLLFQFSIFFMNIEKNLKSQNNVLRHLFRWISTFCALERISRFQFDLLQNTKWRPYKRNFRERTDRITVSSKIFLLNIKQNEKKIKHLHPMSKRIKISIFYSRRAQRKIRKILTFWLNRTETLCFKSYQI